MYSASSWNKIFMKTRLERKPRNIFKRSKKQPRKHIYRIRVMHRRRHLVKKAKDFAGQSRNFTVWFLSDKIVIGDTTITRPVSLVLGRF